MSIVAGIDFGTQSVRVCLVDHERGRLGSGQCSYPLYRCPDDIHHASQRHQDHLQGLESAMAAALASSGIRGHQVEALAVDTTGSTIVPVGEGLEPLDDYYLWCDHRAWREAEEITRIARETSQKALAWSGGTYLSEFGLSKLLHWLRHHPHLRSRFATAVEHCDLITAVLCGITDPEKLPRSICAMGHKWLWNAALGGFPSEEFLIAIDPLLAGIHSRMGGCYAKSDRLAGTLCNHWAARLGLRAGIPIPVGGLDAHWDAVGAGIRPGSAVNVIGTSTCIMALSSHAVPIPGVCGVVDGSIHPDWIGIEAGLSAVGDLFDAIARRATTTTADLFHKIEHYRSGQTGLLRIPWDNGDRTILGNPLLRGMTIGWNLLHEAADELFAAIEGTAFQTRLILERMTDYGVSIERIINTGGIPRKSNVLNQAYANVLKTPLLVPQAETTSLGSAFFAFLALGTFPTLEEAQNALCPEYQTIEPESRGMAVCDELFGHFRELYQSFDVRQFSPSSLNSLMVSLEQATHSDIMSHSGTMSARGSE